MELLFELEPDQLDKLRKTFLHNDGLKLQEFVETMLQVLPEHYSAPSVRVSTIQALQDAFQQVDVNGDGVMSYEECMEALVDSGPSAMFEGGRTAFRFMEHENFARNTSHSLRIRKLKYVPELQILLACEEDRQYIVIYSTAVRGDMNGGFAKIATIDTLVREDVDGGDVFDVVYLPEFNVLALALSNFSIQFWDCRPLGTGRTSTTVRSMRTADLDEPLTVGVSTNRQKYQSDEGKIVGHGQTAMTAKLSSKKPGIPGRFSTQTMKKKKEQSLNRPQYNPVFIHHAPTIAPQRIVHWIGPTSKLLSCGTSPKINIWQINAIRLGFSSWDFKVSHLGELSTHAASISCLIPMCEIGLLASTSLDSTLAVWGIQGLSDGASGTRSITDTMGISHEAKGGGTTVAGGLFLMKHHKNGHKRGIRVGTYLSSARILVTGGYEPYMLLWDMTTFGGAILRRINVGAGVVSLSFLEDPKAPFDPIANLTAKGKTATVGSNAALTVLQQQSTHHAQIVSLDEAGFLKWWDCSRDATLTEERRCLQTFTPSTSNQNTPHHVLTGLICIDYAPVGNRELHEISPPDLLRDSISSIVTGKGTHKGAIILAIGPRIKCFESSRQQEDRAMPAACGYHDPTMSIFAVSRSDVRIFDLLTGSMTKAYRGVLPAEAALNCFAFDGRRRKMVVGCYGGHVVVLSTYNASIMKVLPKHKADVSGVIYVDQDQIVISAGWDGAIYVSDERKSDTDSATGYLLRSVEHAHGPGVPISALAFDYKLSLVATAGGGTRTIHVWDYQELQLLSTGEGHDSDITALAFLSPYSALVSGDAYGVICVWGFSRGESLSCLAYLTHNPIPAPVSNPIHMSFSSSNVGSKTSRRTARASTRWHARKGRYFSSPTLTNAQSLTNKFRSQPSSFSLRALDIVNRPTSEMNHADLEVTPTLTPEEESSLAFQEFYDSLCMVNPTGASSHDLKEIHTSNPNSHRSSSPQIKSLSNSHRDQLHNPGRVSLTDSIVSTNSSRNSTNDSTSSHSPRGTTAGATSDGTKDQYILPINSVPGGPGRILAQSIPASLPQLPIAAAITSFAVIPPRKDIKDMLLSPLDSKPVKNVPGIEVTTNYFDRRDSTYPTLVVGNDNGALMYFDTALVLEGFYLKCEEEEMFVEVPTESGETNNSTRSNSMRQSRSRTLSSSYNSSSRSINSRSPSPVSSARSPNFTPRSPTPTRTPGRQDSIASRITSPFLSPLTVGRQGSSLYIPSLSMSPVQKSEEKYRPILYRHASIVPTSSLRNEAVTLRGSFENYDKDPLAQRTALISGHSTYIPIKLPVQAVLPHQQASNLASYHPRKIFRKFGPGVNTDSSEDPTHPSDSPTQQVSQQDAMNVKDSGNSKLLDVLDEAKSQGDKSLHQPTKDRKSSVPLIDFTAKKELSNKPGSDINTESPGKGKRITEADSVSALEDSVASPSELSHPLSTADAASATQQKKGNSDNQEEPFVPMQIDEEKAQRKLPLVARIIGHQWKPFATVFAHGIEFKIKKEDGENEKESEQNGNTKNPLVGERLSTRLDDSDGSSNKPHQGDGTKSPNIPRPLKKDNRQSVGPDGVIGHPNVATDATATKTNSGWFGFPVRSIRLALSLEFVAILSTGDDGTVRASTLDGRLLASLPVDTGRLVGIKSFRVEPYSPLATVHRKVAALLQDKERHQKDQEDADFTANSDIQKTKSVGLGPYSRSLKSVPSFRDLQEPDTYAKLMNDLSDKDFFGPSFFDGNHAVEEKVVEQFSAIDPDDAGHDPLDWRMRVFLDTRERLLQASANELASVIDQDNFNIIRVQTALQKGKGSEVGYEAVTAAKKKSRRSSIVAVQEYKDHETARELAIQEALQSAIQPSPPASASRRNSTESVYQARSPESSSAVPVDRSCFISSVPSPQPPLSPRRHRLSAHQAPSPRGLQTPKILGRRRSTGQRDGSVPLSAVSQAKSISFAIEDPVSRARSPVSVAGYPVDTSLKPSPFDPLAYLEATLLQPKDQHNSSPQTLEEKQATIRAKAIGQVLGVQTWEPTHAERLKEQKKLMANVILGKTTSNSAQTPLSVKDASRRRVSAFGLSTQEIVSAALQSSPTVSPVETPAESEEPAVTLLRDLQKIEDEEQEERAMAQLLSQKQQSKNPWNANEATANLPDSWDSNLEGGENTAKPTISGYDSGEEGDANRPKLHLDDDSVLRSINIKSVRAKYTLKPDNLPGSQYLQINGVVLVDPQRQAEVDQAAARERKLFPSLYQELTRSSQEAKFLKQFNAAQAQAMDQSPAQEVDEFGFPKALPTTKLSDPLYLAAMSPPTSSVVLTRGGADLAPSPFLLSKLDMLLPKKGGKKGKGKKHRSPNRKHDEEATPVSHVSNFPVPTAFAISPKRRTRSVSPGDNHSEVSATVRPMLRLKDHIGLEDSTNQLDSLPGSTSDAPPTDFSSVSRPFLDPLVFEKTLQKLDALALRTPIQPLEEKLYVRSRSVPPRAKVNSNVKSNKMSRRAAMMAGKEALLKGSFVPGVDANLDNLSTAEIEQAVVESQTRLGALTPSTRLQVLSEVYDVKDEPDVSKLLYASTSDRNTKESILQPPSLSRMPLGNRSMHILKSDTAGPSTVSQISASSSYGGSNGSGVDVDEEDRVSTLNLSNEQDDPLAPDAVVHLIRSRLPVLGTPDTVLKPRDINSRTMSSTITHYGASKMSGAFHGASDLSNRSNGPHIPSNTSTTSSVRSISPKGPMNARMDMVSPGRLRPRDLGRRSLHSGGMSKLQGATETMNEHTPNNETNREDIATRESLVSTVSNTSFNRTNNSSSSTTQDPRNTSNYKDLYSLTPEQYAVLSRRLRIGGQLRSAVVSFQNLIQKADKSSDGTVTYDEFIRQIEQGRGGLSHMRRHLEAMFRAIDKDNNGYLAIHELTEVMFSKATPLQRREITAFAMYSGPVSIAEEYVAPSQKYSAETVSQVRELFNIYDTTGKGSIGMREAENVARMLSRLPSSSLSLREKQEGAKQGNSEFEDDIRSVLATLPVNSKGNIEFESFLQLMGPAFEAE